MGNEPPIDSGKESSFVSEKKGLGNFWSELRRRKVVRVAITYAIVAWLIIQIASTTFADFGIPVWAFRFVVIMLGLFFPVAIILAWAFELTPDGIKTTRNARQDLKEHPLTESQRKQRNWLAYGIGAILPTLIFGTLAIVFYFGIHTDSGTFKGEEIAVSTERPYYIGSIAVLPLTVISGNEEIRATAEGLHEELLTTFAEMGPLNVVSRSSVMQYAKDRPTIPEIGKNLGADFVAEGSIQAVGENLRVTIQVIEAVTDNHIWAKTFDRGVERFKDPLRFQKELAFELAFLAYKVLSAEHPPSGKEQELLQKAMDEAMRAAREGVGTFFKHNDVYSFEEGIRSLDTLYSLNPDNPWYHERKTWLLRVVGELGIVNTLDPEFSVRYYLQLKRTVLTDPFNSLNLLRRYYADHENNLHMAIEAGERYFDLAEKNQSKIHPSAYYGMALYYAKTGQAKKAMNLLKKSPVDHMRQGSEGRDKLFVYAANNAYPELIIHLEKRIEELSNVNKAIENPSKSLDRRLMELEIGLALTEAYWSADTTPLLETSLMNFIDSGGREYLSVDELITFLSYFFIDAVFPTKRYDWMLKTIPELFTKLKPLDVPTYKSYLILGFAYQEQGNAAFAESYLKGSINEMVQSLRGQWAKMYEPDIYYSQMAICHALLGEEDQAKETINTALEKADIIRNYADYFDTLHGCAAAYAQMSEVQEACVLIDQILSNPSFYSTGRILIDPMLEGLHDQPAFQAVIRKHADQLKDPNVLEEYFGNI